MSNSSTLVLWSGGLDSTAVLVKCLKKGEKVRSLAVNHDQVASAKLEKKTREKLKKKLKEHGFYFQHEEVYVKGRGRAVNVGDGISQANIWLAAAAGNLENGEILKVGYIAEDDFWHYRQWYIEAFNNLLIVNGKKDCSIEFPLEWDRKWEIIDYLKKERLISLTWYCEDPTNGKRCNKCFSCIKMKTARFELKLRNGN